MFNKLHNGNTEALPLIRKEKSIAIINSHLAMLVLYYADDMAAFRQPRFPAVRHRIWQSSYFVSSVIQIMWIKIKFMFKTSGFMTISAWLCKGRLGLPYVKPRLPFKSVSERCCVQLCICVCVYESLRPCSERSAFNKFFESLNRMWTKQMKKRLL